MTQKELEKYLNSAYELNLDINSKIAQKVENKSLACKCTANYENDGTSNPSKSNSQEKILCKIADLERAIDNDIDRLVDLKNQIAEHLAKVDNPRYRNLLEFRYLCFMKWDEVAAIMSYSRRQITRLHTKALEFMSLNVHLDV